MMIDSSCHKVTRGYIAMFILLLYLFVGPAYGQSTPSLTPSGDSTVGISLATKLKNQGDEHYRQKETVKASEFYIKALAAAPDGTFSVEQRKEIAERIMNGGEPEEAERIFRKLSEEKPGEKSIRLNLAKALVKQEEWKRALDESEKILVEDKHNLQALMIKANCLSKQKKHSEAILIYHLILENEEDYDARTGLTNSLMAIGKNAEAKKNINLINVEEEWQKLELKELSHELDSVIQPAIELINNNYSDSDKNATTEFAFSVKSDFKDWLLTSGYSYKTAKSPDNSGNYSAESFYVGATNNINANMRLMAKLGFSVLNTQSSTLLPTGKLKLDTHLGGDVFTLSFTEDALTATADIIGNTLEMGQAGFTINHPLTKRINLIGGYLFKKVTDGNSANDLQASAQYILFKELPKLTLAYKFHYINFDYPAHHSYFDPQDFSSHAIVLTAFFEKNPYYANLGIDFGKQSFWRNDRYQSSLYGYANLTVGIKPIRNLMVEFDMEGSNSAASHTSNSWLYYIIGARLSYMF